MSLTALIDSDTPVVAAALSAELDELWVATSRLDRSIENIIQASGCTDYKLFVSGKNNFRHEIYPNYKANRTQPSPKWREDCRQHLIEKWGAIEATGCEADDLCGIYQSEDTIICGIDKDLLQIPGKHFSWEIIRKGKIVREAGFKEVSKIEGLRTFYKQVLTGDTSDNIIGIHGVGPVKASKYIDHLEREDDMIQTVLEFYVETYGEYQIYMDNFQLNADLLWIMREPGTPYSLRGLNNE